MDIKRIKGILQLFRVELPLAAGICTLLGAIIATGGLPPLKILLPGFFCVFFISSSAMISNDYFDLETDRVNAPNRPLPSGSVLSADAVFFTFLTALLGLGAAALISWTALVVTFFFWAIGLLYNWRGKSSGLTGNLMVSTCVGGMFIFGGIAGGDIRNPVVWTLGGLAFCFDLGEEIAADAMDMEGDRLRGSRSIAILKGRRFALIMAGLVFGAFILVSFLPMMFKWLGEIYPFLLPIMDGYIVFCTSKILLSRSTKDGKAWIRWNYLGVTFCLLTFLVARLAVH